MEDFVLIFEVDSKWNNSKCKRLLGLEQEKLNQGVANILTDFKGSKTLLEWIARTRFTGVIVEVLKKVNATWLFSNNL